MVLNGVVMVLGGWVGAITEAIVVLGRLVYRIGRFSLTEEGQDPNFHNFRKIIRVLLMC